MNANLECRPSCHTQGTWSDLKKKKKKKAIRVVETKRLMDVHVRPEEETIGIGEGQFFEDLVAFTFKHLKNKNIIISTFYANYKGLIYSNVAALIPFRGKLDKKAVCALCRKKEALLTKRLLEDQDTEFIAGGEEIYQSLCLNCWQKK